MTNKNEFEGLTRSRCAAGCSAERCIISEGPYCAHPTKGGLQVADMGNPAALARAECARDFLARAALEANLSQRKASGGI